MNDEIDVDPATNPVSSVVPPGPSPSTKAAPSPFRVEAGTRVVLAEIDPDQQGEFEGKKEGKKELERQQKRIQELQERLYAENKQSLLVIFQATDTGGKDGAISHIFGGVNPQGCQVWSFKQPTEEELAHDFLWRIHQKTPRKGMIAVFNRSHYEDVLVVRVKELVPESVWRARYDHINAWERLVADANTTILKFFLHISKEEQGERLQARLDDPSKHWKFDKGDLVERGYWNAYQEAYEEVLSHCSTEVAPWYVIPANRKWYRNAVIAEIIADTLERMAPHYPLAEEGLDKIVIPE